MLILKQDTSCSTRSYLTNVQQRDFSSKKKEEIQIAGSEESTGLPILHHELVGPNMVLVWFGSSKFEVPAEGTCKGSQHCLKMGPFQLWPSNWEAQIRSGKMGEDPHQRCNFSGQQDFWCPYFQKKTRLGTCSPNVDFVDFGPSCSGIIFNELEHPPHHERFLAQRNRPAASLNMVSMRWSKLLVNWFPCCVCWVITPMNHIYIYLCIISHSHWSQKPQLCDGP